MYTVADLLASRARSDATATAVESGDERISYADLLDLSRRRAGQIAAAGVGRGDRVAILLPKSVEALAVFFGCQMVGAVAIFVSDTIKQQQVTHIVHHSGAAVVFTNARLRRLLSGVGSEPDVVDVVDPVAGIDCPTNPAISRDLAVLMYTSGSTGMPKGVMVTQENLLAGAAIVADYLQLSNADRTLSLLPWSFDYGLNQVLATFMAGGTVIIAPSTFAPDICRVLRQSRATGLAGVPPLWAVMTARHSPFLTTDLPDLRYITNSGGAFPPGTIDMIAKAHPDLSIYLMYGLTEAFRSTYLPSSMLGQHPTSMGRAIPNTEILVLNEDGSPCAPYEVGELVHRGPTVAAGYWRDPQASARVFRTIPGPPGGFDERVVHSGDYVYRDDEGYLYYVGRRDEQFKSRGMRANPTEIEAVLLASDLLSEAVVFGAPRPDDDPLITAVVVAARPPLVPADVLDLSAAQLPAYLQPARVVVVDSLPRTGSGKVDRTAVKLAHTQS